MVTVLLVERAVPEFDQCGAPRDRELRRGRSKQSYYDCPAHERADEDDHDREQRRIPGIWLSQSAARIVLRRTQPRIGAVRAFCIDRNRRRCRSGRRRRGPVGDDPEGMLAFSRMTA